MKKAFSKKNLWEISPAWSKKVVGTILNLLPIEYLLGKRYRQTVKLIRDADKWTRIQVEQYQLARLKEVVNTAYNKSAAYRVLFDQYGINVNELDSLENFSTLPLIDKKFINDNLDDLLIVDRSAVNVDYVTTGGTSGIPLTFYINSSRSEVEYAYLTEGWRRAGFALGDLKAVLRGKITGKNSDMHHSYDPVLKENNYSNFHMDDTSMALYVRHMASLGPCFFHAYPSSAYMLARFVNNKPELPELKFKAVLVESENVYPKQREFVEQVFGCRYFSLYGQSEKLIAAGECEHSTDYHIWPTYGYFELIGGDGKKITEPGQTGEIVGTGFINTVMPFIRYKTGDYAEYVSEHCEYCKRNHTVIRNIRGHNIQEHLIAADNSLIPWSAVNMHDDTFDNVRQYQFYQETAGHAVIKVVVSSEFSKINETRIIENINKKLNGKVAVSVMQVTSINLTERGKSIFVDQRILL